MAAIALAAIVTIGARPALAAPTLTEDSQPHDQQALAESPKELLLVFSENLAEAPRVTMVETTSQLPVAGLSATSQLDSADQWMVSLSTTLAPGTYRVTWISGAATGTYTFTVGTVTPATAPGDPSATGATTAPSGDGGAPTTTVPGTTGASTAPPSIPTPVTFLGRLLASLGIGALAGGLLLITVCWPEGVEYVVARRHLRVAWAVGLAGSVLSVVAARAALDGSSVASAMSPSSWTDLLDTTSGKALLARLALVAASAWVAFGPDRIVDPATQIPALAGPLLTVVTFGFARSSGSVLGIVAIPAGIVHAGATFAWFGGLALLVRVVLRGPGDEDLVHAVRGFNRIAGPALLIALGSGMLLTARVVGGFGALFSTGYGRTLLLKAVAFWAMATVAVANRAAVTRRLGRSPDLRPRPAALLRRSIGAEALIGTFVLLLTAFMVTRQPAGIEVAAAADAPTTERPALEARLSGDGVDVSVGIGPGTIGNNDLTIEVAKPATGLVEMTVQLMGPVGEEWIYVIDVTPRLKGEGTMTVADVPLCTPGDWRAVVNGQDTNGKLPEVQQAFSIKDLADKPAECVKAAAVPVSVPTPLGATTSTPPSVAPATLPGNAARGSTEAPATTG